MIRLAGPLPLEQNARTQVKLDIRTGQLVYPGEAHDLTSRREDKHAAPKQIIHDTVHKLARGQVAKELLLPLPDGVEPIDPAREDLWRQPQRCCFPCLHYTPSASAWMALAPNRMP